MKLNPSLRFLRSLQPLVAATALLLAHTSADAAAYIKFDGVDGESKGGTDKDHTKWSDILSFDWGASESGTAGSGGAVVLQPSQFRVEIAADMATPRLLEAAATGKAFATVELHIISEGAEPGDEREFVVKLSNVMITSFQARGRAGEPPAQTLSLNYEEIKWTYVHADRSKGKVEATWKVEEGRG